MTYSTDRFRLLNGDTTCVEIIQSFLPVALANKNNAFIQVFEKDALERAHQLDSELNAGKSGKLTGMVISVKDLISIKDQVITGSSKILKGYTSPYNATAIQRILDEGAIIIGISNADEFGMGSSNENSHYGPVTNPIDTSRVPGGSSGGAAVSVLEGSCHLAIGTDTGGSVRQPASFCGLYGLKPTYSRISRFGLLAYASSFDTIGLIGEESEDIQLVLEVMQGKDPQDSTSSVKSPSENRSIKKIAYFKQAMEGGGLQTDIREGFTSQISALKKSGIEIDEIDFPLSEYLLETYYILTTAEASSNLSRYDGFRYGYGDAAKKAGNLEESYVNTRTLGFGSEVKRRIFLGTFALSASYYDAYYSQAQKARRMIRNRTLELLDNYDLILSPVTPTTAFKIGEHSKDPLEMYLSDLYTVHASVCGLPAISIPLGYDHSGLPYGIQATANDFEEYKLLSFAKYLANLESK